MIQNGQQAFFVRIPQSVRAALTAEQIARLDGISQKIDQFSVWGIVRPDDGKEITEILAQWREAGNGNAVAIVNAQLAIAIETVCTVDTPIALDAYRMYLTNAMSGDLTGTLVVCVEPLLRTVLLKPSGYTAQHVAWTAVTTNLTVQDPRIAPRPWRTIDETPDGTIRGNPNYDANPQNERGIFREIEHP